MNRTIYLGYSLLFAKITAPSGNLIMSLYYANAYLKMTSENAENMIFFPSGVISTAKQSIFSGLRKGIDPKATLN